jgi:outer membrane protein assembly factor BamD (BamD/ComL family)
MSPHRITKKEIKQDKFVTYSLMISEWIQKHLNQVLIVAGGLILVTVVVAFLISSKNKRERKSAELFGRANLELQAGNIGAALSDLQTVVNQYGNSKSAGQATFYLASAYFYAKDYTQAQAWFEKYLNNYGQDALLTSSARAGIADCHLQRGDFLQAGDSYVMAVSLCPTGFIAPQYLLKAADAYLQADQKEKAKETLDRLLSQYPDSKEVRQAKLKLAENL